MRKAKVFFNKGILAGVLIENDDRRGYTFEYDSDYHAAPVSLTMPINKKIYHFDEFPPYFDGVLPEGPQLEALLRLQKLDRGDCFGQLMYVGKDLVGAFSVIEDKNEQ